MATTAQPVGNERVIRPIIAYREKDDPAHNFREIGTSWNVPISLHVEGRV